MYAPAGASCCIVAISDIILSLQLAAQGRQRCVQYDVDSGSKALTVTKLLALRQLFSTSAHTGTRTCI